MTLTLPPFFEMDVTEAGFGEKRPLADVEVCVVRSRPYNGAWEDFVDVTDAPCVIVPAGEKPVLTNVPGLAEIVVTASKEGYRPVVLAVTTWEWDSDMSEVRTVDGDYWWKNSLVRLGAPWPHVDPRVPVSPAEGDLSFALVNCAEAGCISQPDARVSIESAAGQPAGSGPHYWYRGKVVPGATGTIGSEWSNALDLAGTSFVNLPEGEYTLVPRLDGALYCDMWGRGDGDAFHGYARRDGLLAPVLRGHSTIALGMGCSCDEPSGYFFSDAGACAPLADAGER